MAVKIRLKRMGKIRAPYYRVVVVDSRKKRDGKVIEEIGKYHPKEEPSFIEVTSDRAQYWLGVGAQPTEAVEAILKVTGDWQKFKGLPGAEGTLQAAEAKRDKTEVFNEALKESAGEPQGRGGDQEVRRQEGRQAKAETPKPTEAPAAEPPRVPAAEADRARPRPPDRRGRGHRRRPRPPPAVTPRSRPRADAMLAEALEHLVRGIVDHPDDVTVQDKQLRRGLASSRCGCTPTTSAR